jgi:hypothetical protein
MRCFYVLVPNTRAAHYHVWTSARSKPGPFEGTGFRHRHLHVAPLTVPTDIGSPLRSSSTSA